MSQDQTKENEFCSPTKNPSIILKQRHMTSVLCSAPWKLICCNSEYYPLATVQDHLILPFKISKSGGHFKMSPWTVPQITLVSRPWSNALFLEIQVISVLDHQMFDPS